MDYSLEDDLQWGRLGEPIWKLGKRLAGFISVQTTVHCGDPQTNDSAWSITGKFSFLELLEDLSLPVHLENKELWVWEG